MASTILIAAGIVCILYGITVMMVGSGTLFFAFWYVLGATLVLAGWAVHAGYWEGLPLIGRRVIQVVACVALAGFVAVTGVIATHFNDRGEDGLDYVIVLGAQVYERGPSVVLQYRLDAAYDYLADNPQTNCIVTGGQGPNEHAPEADVMADYLIACGIVPERIVRERASLNTVQNMAFSTHLLDPQHDRVGIVSNNFHLFRALAIARKQGYANACGISAPTSLWYLPNNMVRESLGLAKDFAAGNLQ